ncbi:hypothetical protein OIU84_007026 [Salix udensis]|uniref:Uncharacterized protein n=1 Tax=Salix udensis TaxID=889485 RepID=A0AAD6JZU7_9ROSI|nr:hypothetical protein OIU84_007026 [Salix udensis]
MKDKPLEWCLKRIRANLTTLQLKDFLPFLLGKTHCTLHISGLSSEHLCFTKSMLNSVSRRAEKRTY